MWQTMCLAIPHVADETPKTMEDVMIRKTPFPGFRASLGLTLAGIATFAGFWTRGQASIPCVALGCAFFFTAMIPIITTATLRQLAAALVACWIVVGIGLSAAAGVQARWDDARMIRTIANAALAKKQLS